MSCINLEIITLPHALKQIGKNAFDGCPIKQIEIPSNLELIDDEAFINTKLTEVDLKSCLKIGESAFAQCSDLIKFSFSSNLQTISSFAFEGTSIRSLEFPQSLCHLDRSCFQKMELLETADMRRSNVTAIPPFAFSGCHALFSAELPAGLESIGEEAFRGCALCDIAIPPSLAVLGRGAFRSCRCLREIDLSSSSVRTVPSLCFKDCSSLSSVALGGVAEIQDSAFCRSGLSEVNVPPSVQKMGAAVFLNCTRLARAVFCAPSSLAVPPRCFAGCCSLSAVDLACTAEVGEMAFAGCAFTLLSLASSVTSIGRRSFALNRDLEAVDLSDTGIRALPSHAFASCPSLRSVSLPASLSEAAPNSFAGCPSIAVLSECARLDAVHKLACAMETRPCVVSRDCQKNLLACAPHPPAMAPRWEMLFHAAFIGLIV